MFKFGRTAFLILSIIFFLGALMFGIRACTNSAVDYVNDGSSRALQNGETTLRSSAVSDSLQLLTDLIAEVENTSYFIEEEPIETRATNNAANSQAKGSGDYKVIVGSFRMESNAERRKNLLKSFGYPAFSKKLINRLPEAQGLISVMANRYDAYNSAINDVETLRDKHQMESYLVKRSFNPATGLSQLIYIDVSDPHWPRKLKVIPLYHPPSMLAEQDFYNQSGASADIQEGD